METKILQFGHSHASCGVAIMLAAKAMLNKIPENSDRMRKLELSEQEMSLVKDVIEKFKDAPSVQQTKK